MNRLRTVVSLLASTILVLALAPQATSQPALEATVDVHVATSGDDTTADGSAGNPFATPAAARDHVRTLIADGMDGDVQVLVHEGRYELGQPLRLEEADSGRDGYTVTWTSAPGETAEVVGARSIDGTWESTESPDIQRIHIPAVADGSWRFDQLVVNGERRTKARFPDEGYLAAAGGAGNRREFYFAHGDLSTWTPGPGSQVVVWPSPFFRDTIGVTDIDAATRTITVSDDLFSGMGVNNDGRYFLQGFREALDSPGEFYLDEAEGYLYYWPTAEESLDTSSVLAPTTQNVIEVVGSSADAPVHDIAITGLHLSMSAFTPYFTETHDGEWNRPAPENTPGVVYLENARDVAITNNVITNAGFNGVSMYLYNQGNTIARNEIHGFGYHGVLMMGTRSGTLNANGEQVYDNRGNLVSDNYIHDGGALVGQGSGIFLHQSGENVVEHNVIHDMPRYGIGAKGNRQPAQAHELTSRDNVIRYNDISAVLLDSDDAGAVTFTTTGPGNVIENNRLHDLPGAPQVTRGQTYGIYLDNQNTYATARHNLIHDIGATAAGSHHGPITVKGPYNSVINNVLIENSGTGSAFGISNMQHGANTAIDHRYERNVMVLESEGAAFYTFTNFEDDNLAVSDDNVIHDVDGTYVVHGVAGVHDHDDWRTYGGGRYDQNSLFTDPLLRDSASGDYALSPDSPAYSLGIDDIDLAPIGTTAAAPFQPGDLDRIHVTADGHVSHGDIAVGDAVALDITARDAIGLLIPGTGVTRTFTSADNAVATVDDNGVVTGHAPGTTTVIVTADDGSGAAQIAFPIYVGDSVQSISVDTESDVLAIGGQVEVRTVAHTMLGTARLLDPNTDDVTFTSDEETVATVSADGTVHALGPGTATITVGFTSGPQTLTTSVSITVAERVLESVEITTDTLGVPVRTTTAVHTAAAWSDGTAADPSTLDLAYTSSDESIATVGADGTITGVAPGNAQIRVTASSNGLDVHNQMTTYVVRDSELPAGWNRADIGTWADPESYVDHNGGRFVVNSNSEDAWGTSDRVTYVYQDIDLNDYPDGLSITATVESVGAVHVNSMAGVMIRDDLDPAAANVSPRIRPGGAMPVGVRREPGGGTSNPSANPVTTFPASMKLTYADGVFTSSYFVDDEWVEMVQVDLALSGPATVGIWTAAADTAGLTEAAFSDVQIVAVPPTPATPESLAELQRMIEVATAFHDTSTAGSGHGEYPADALAYLQAAINAAQAVLGEAGLTESRVEQELSTLTGAMQGYHDTRHTPTDFTLDFTDDAVGQPPTSVTSPTPENGTIIVADGGYDGRNAMVLTGTSSDYAGYVARADLPVAADHTTYTMRFKPEQTTAPFIVELAAANPNQKVMYLWFVGDGTIRLVNGDGSQVRGLGRYSANQWHTVGVTVDIAAQTFDLDLDGARLISTVPFRQQVTAIETMTWRAGQGTFWIDQVTTGPVESDDASLESITIDGSPLAGFDPAVTEYVVPVAPDSPAPSVGAGTHDPAGSTYVIDADGVPGSAVVVSIAANRVDHRVYSVEFTCGSHTSDETIVIGGADTEVPNYPRTDTCTFLDLLSDAAPVGDGDLIRTVQMLAAEWHAAGLLARSEYRSLVKTAAQQQDE